MKLYYSAKSPFVRKVRVLALEKGLHTLIDLVEIDPHASPAELLAANPLSKVPALELDNGETLYDSPVICEFLDSIDDARPMIPQDGSGHFKLLTLCALADGMMDAAVAARMEQVRPEQYCYPQFIERQLAAVRRGFEALEQETDFLRTINLAAIAVGVMCGYVDFRHDTLGWRNIAPELASWYEKFSQRPSMLETVPVA